jgi:predicted DNA-binding transcriptional regulator AlpA
MAIDPEDRILRLPGVLRLFPVSRSAWYQGIAEGRFPAGIKLSERAVGWKKSDIDKLVASLATSRPRTVPFES